MFKYNKLALSIAAIMFTGGLAAPLATAQSTEALEEVSVTGIRGSLQNAMNTKRDATSVVDSISAEDLGKFPDQNVAESLQRITGVTIERDSGEGSKISVRGFGPEYNNVLLNNRTLPTDHGGRAFSFDLLASELITGADVHKTSSADMQEGAIGGTVNVATARPLDYDGFKSAATIKGVKDTLADGTGPYFSGLVSNNMGDFGVLASFAYQEREARRDAIGVIRWNDTDVVPGSDPSGETSVGAPPQDASQTFSQQDRSRIGGTLALQWTPTDNMKVTADALYSRLEAKDNTTKLSRWFSQPLFNAEIDSQGTVTAFDRVPKPISDTYGMGVYQLADNGQPLGIGQWNTTAAQSIDRNSDTHMVGLNLEWDLTDNLMLEADLQSSGTKGRSLDNPSIALATPTQEVTHFEMNGGSFAWGQGDDFVGTPDMYAPNGIKFFSDLTDDEITEGRIDLSWIPQEGTFVTKVKGGLYTSDREKRVRRHDTVASASNAFSGFITNVPADLLSMQNVGDFMSEYGSGNFVQSWYTYDPQELVAYLMSDAALENAEHAGQQLLQNLADGHPDFLGVTQADADAASAAKLAEMMAAQQTGFGAVLNPANSWEVEEQTTSAYTQVDFGHEIGSMLLSGNAGLRYTQTDVSSAGNGAVFLGLDIDTTTGSATALTDSGANVSADSDYSALLPSLNLKLEITEELVARAGYSKTMTRPQLSDLSPKVNIGGSVAFTDVNNIGFEGSMSGDNPQLKPYKSNNFDLGLEWYYGEGSYASASVFHKEIEDWITNQSRTVQLADPMHGGELRNFIYTSPVNNDEADATGLELAILHSFDNGFGVQANYTYMDSSAAFDADREDQSFTLEGLSEHAYNLIGFYEQDKWAARVAYNWRDSYLQSPCHSWACVPLSVEPYGQVDASVSYYLNDQFTVFADVINLLDEDTRKYTKYESRLISLEDTGARFSLGVRATF